MRLTVYYQTFREIHDKIWNQVSRVIIASLHFMPVQGGGVRLHLNDNPPDDSIFDDMWETMEEFAVSKPVGILIGGAGGGLSPLLDPNWKESAYAMLQALLAARPYIGTIVIDVEEIVDLDSLCEFLSRFRKDYPHHGIAMTPICGAVTTTTPGMGGFRYSDLVDKCSAVDEFLVQIYMPDSFTPETVSDIQKKYPKQVITSGFLTSEFVPSDLQKRASLFTSGAMWEIGEPGTEACVRAMNPYYKNPDWDTKDTRLTVLPLDHNF